MLGRRGRGWLAVAAASTTLLAVVPAIGRADDGAVQVPVWSRETPAGKGTTTPAPDRRPVRKTIDGHIDDWIGRSTRFGGSRVYDAGELVYQDHLFDAWGADDGRDADRLATFGTLSQAVPETYRLDPLEQADLPGELGLPSPEAISAEEHYGDAPQHQDAADLEEVRVAADRRRLVFLARTTTMTAPDQTAVLVLADTVPGTVKRTVPFNTGLTTESADVAFLFAGTTGWVADLATGAVTALPAGSVATDDTGWTNAVEAAVPRTLVPGATVKLLVAAGTYNGSGGVTSVANVAFRPSEPVRIWFDQQQALALFHHDVDQFFTTVDADRLVAGASETYRPGAGYHDRIFTSDAAISAERGEEGVFQHYGVYVPSSYDPSKPASLTFWLHWRGGKAHSAAAFTPRVMKEYGEDRGSLVVSPRGRGTSSWYLGKGLVDVNEVWDDALASFAVARDRVYVTGHSMGGFGSYLLSVLYPDRFAAAVPVSPPVTQGAFTGLDFPGCDSFAYEEYTPCYVQANDGDARTEHTLKLLENLRNTPIAIYAGGVDELVPIGGQIRQMQRLVELGYRHRLYVFPTYEHYTPPLVDEWSEMGRYMDAHRRPSDPAQVTYVRDMPFEHAVENGPDLTKPAGLSFDFDRAWWLSELTPVDAATGRASFDGRSLAIAAPAQVTIPEAGGPTSPGQTGPYEMTGLTTVDDPTAAAPATSNGFTASLTGASAARLDLAAMKIDARRRVTAQVRTDAPLSLRLAGAWSTVPSVTVDGQPVAVTLAGGVLTVTVTAGNHQLVIG